MRKISVVLFFTISLVGFHTLTLAQTRENILIAPDSTWGKEIFEFPLSFAPQLAYSGIEEAWFPKNWIKKDSAAFWSYAFVWKIKTNIPLTGQTLQSNLKTYFNGLMRAQSNEPNPKILNTEVITWNENKANGTSSWKGKIRIYDAFSSKAPLDLFLTIEQVFSKDTSVSLVLFRFSPMQLDNSIWTELNRIRIQQE